MSCSDVGVIPLLIGVSPGRKITEKLPADELFITPVSSDGDEHDSDFVSRNNGDPDARARVRMNNKKCTLQNDTINARMAVLNLSFLLLSHKPAVDMCIVRGSTVELIILGTLHSIRIFRFSMQMVKHINCEVMFTHCTIPIPALNYFDRPLKRRSQGPASSLSMDNYCNSMQQLRPLHSPSYRHLSFLILLSIHSDQVKQCYRPIHPILKLFVREENENGVLFVLFIKWE